MYSSLTAVVLCIVTQAAAAQSAGPVPVAQQTPPTADLIKKKPVVSAPPMAPAHAGGELIKTATAGTHDELPGVGRSAPAATRSAPVAVAGAPDDSQHRRGSSGMLLAALALMSGIALRRFGAHKE